VLLCAGKHYRDRIPGFTFQLFPQVPSKLLNFLNCRVFTPVFTLGLPLTPFPGIGDGKILRDQGIKVILDLPGVGNNLRKYSNDFASSSTS
jgi:hypothetical protein